MQDVKVLVFVGTEGEYHDHAGQGAYIASFLTGTGGIQAEVSRDYEVLADGLAAFDTVLGYTDVGELTAAQEQGLLDHVRAGGGFFGLHTAAASFRGNAGYHDMLNAFFDGHSKYMDFRVDVVDAAHPVTQGMDGYGVTDELYYLRHDPSRSHWLMQANDPTTDSTHVMAFHHRFGQGKVFYYALGHDSAVLENASFQQVARRGVLWTAGALP